MAEQYDVVVVGLGAMGAATLYQLAKRGVRVIGIDRFSPPHDQGSSHGDTRITRQAVGEGAEYVPLVKRSHRIWREIEAEMNVSLFEQCGVLIMTSSATPTSHHGTEDFTRRTIELAKTYGIEHEVLSAAEIRTRFPQFAPVRDDAIGYFEPGGGYVRPEQCIAAQLALAARHGAVLRTDCLVNGIEECPDGVKVTTANGTIVARQAIVSAGMWSAQLLGEPFEHLLKVCRQKLYWFKLAEPVIFPEASPSFILAHGPRDEDICYGFPPIPGEGSMKIATEQYTLRADPDALNREVSTEEAAEMFETQLLGRFAGVMPELMKSSVCTYTVTPDFGFIIDRHPSIKNVTVISACSGHGFKHSAGIGEALAQQVVNGRSDSDLMAFSLRRFARNEGAASK